MMSATLPLSETPAARAPQKLLAGLLAALGAFLPFSTAGVSIVLGVLVLMLPLAGLQPWREGFWRRPVFASGLLLLAYIVLRSVAEAGWQPHAAKLANHYHELLMIPLLWLLMRAGQGRRAFLYGLMAGAFALALVHWLPLPADWANKLALRRISAGFGLSLCAFVFFEEARNGVLPRRLAYALVAFLAVTVAALVQARTGYVTLALLTALAAWRAMPRRWRWVSVVVVVVAAALMATLMSSLREKRGDTAISNRIRAEFLHNGLEVTREHWLFGAGWGGYGKAYAEVAARNGAPADALWAQSENAHNEYLMQAAAGGAPALLMFLAWLAIPVAGLWRRSPQERAGPAGTLACVALAFAVGCAFNSLLLDFIEAHLYGALLAWLLARQDLAPATPPPA
jgi:O-antigen ligase